ncbi:hypothetical protein [Actinacidiphila glaucinigra]|uniref:hypothetical protein n=1 Tax=Actinacidiphila glaucinigra TaxID=235986 RepID=UPI00366C12C7
MSEVHWTELSAGATAVTAVISLIALLAVAWQSFLTRSGVDVSQAVLLAGDRGRLDDRAPEVSVRLEEPTWPLLAWSHLGMPCNPWPGGHDWHFPEREGDRTVLQAAVVLENLSGRAIEARFEGDFAVAAEDNRELRAPSPLIVPARETGGADGEVRVFLQANFTAKELSENYEAREQGLPLPHRAVGTISVRDDRDNGTTDTWDLSLSGCPIQPHETRGSVWVTVPFHITEGSGLRSLEYDLLPPRRRTYWISRRDGIELPAPTFTVRTNWWRRLLGR